MKIGVQTKGVLEKGFREGFALIRRAGFDCVDFNLDAFLLNSDVYAGKFNAFFEKTEQELVDFFKPYARAMEDNRLVPSQMHAPYPVQVFGRTGQNAYMMENVIPKSFIVAEILGIPYMVVHPIKLQYKAGREAEYEENLRYFSTLIPYARKHHVMVCLENLYEGLANRIIEGPCANPYEAVWYIDNLNDLAGEELFGFCLDTGHMNLVKRKPFETISALGKHLKIMHIHDNDSVGDLHHMPFTFRDEEGNGDGICWNEIIMGLKNISYNGVLSFETYPCVNSFPVAISEQVLTMIAHIGRYFVREIEK